MNTQIFNKAKENYICNGYQRLANLESLKEWAKTNTVQELPKYVKPPRIKLTAGAFNFIRSLRP